MKDLAIAYEATIASYRERTQQALADAQDADSILRWALLEMSTGYDIGFLPTAPESLTEARQMRRNQGTRTGRDISLKELSDQEIQTRLDNAADGKFGSGTIKPAAEFIGYRSWLNSADSIQKRDWDNANSYFIGGTPAYAAGQGSWLLETSGGGGLHRKPTLVNKVGMLGGRVFGFPVGVVATGLDFCHTPAMSASQRPDAKIMAPKDPGRVHWK
ncbi:hypothetical protein [Streptomyces sp. NPDC059258]|uniref:hypothetical protein n=1 Tax=unclassified Streptomyces TaxID=2593676 RepID=UPI0036C92E81